MKQFSLSRIPKSLNTRIMRIVLVYLVTGILWILLSDKLMGILAPSPEFITRVSLIKGLFWIAATALALYFMVRAEMRAVNTSESRYRLLAENVVDVIWVMDLSTGHFIYVSPSVERLRGYTPEEVLGQTMADVMTPESLTRISTELPERLAAFAAGESWAVTMTHEIEQTRRDGSTIWTEVVTTLLPGEQNKLEVLGVSRDISERKRSEQLRKETEERLRLAINATNIGFFDWDISTGQIRYSLEWKRQLGFEDDELENAYDTWFSRLHPDDVEETMRVENEFMANPSQELTKEFRLRHKDGSYRAILSRSTVILNSQGKPARMIGYHIDITDRRSAEEQLRASEQALNEAQRVAQVGSWKWIPADNKVIWSEEMFRLFGVERESNTVDLNEVITQSIHPDDRAKVIDLNRQVLSGGQPAGIEYRVILSGGIERTLWAQPGGRQLDARGKILTLTGIVQDITERKKAEQALRASELYYRALVANVPLVFFSIDTNGVFTLSDGKGLEKIRLTPGQVVGMHVTDVYHDYPDVLAAVGRALAGETVTTDLVVEGVTFQCWFHPVSDDNDKVTGMIGVARDISDQKKAEIELTDREAQWHGVIETSADGFLMIDTQGKILESNGAYEATSGFSRAELLSMSLVNLEARESSQDIKNRIQKIASKQVDLFETLHRKKNGTIWQVEVNASYWPIRDGRLFVFLRDITRRKRSESLLRTRLQLSDMAYHSSLDDLLQATLDAAELFTGSSISFFHFVAPDQNNLTLKTWSTNTVSNFCTAEKTQNSYPIESSGVWTDCLRERRPIIHNDFASLPNRKGMPAGHPPVVRELTIPVMRDDRVAAIIGVGNKIDLYTQDDLEIVSELASMAMDIISRKLDNEALQKQTEEMRQLYEAGRQLSSTLDLQEICQILYNNISQAVPCNVMLISAYDRETELIHCLGMYDQDGQVDTSALPPVKLNREGRGTQSLVICNARSYLMPDYVAFANTSKRMYYVDRANPVIEELPEEADRPRSAVMVPLMAEGLVVGVLQIFSYRINAHTEDHLRFVEALAYRVSAAMANARLFDQLQAELKERRRVEEEIRRLNTDLEQRVADRTADLSRVNAELKRAARAKDEFLASMSHELRTPLNAILTLTESLEEGIYGGMNDRQLKSVRTVAESGHHLLNVINDILDLSKIEAGKLNLQINSIEVEGVCQSSLRLVRQQAQKKQLHINLELDPRVSYVRADSRYLKQMLVNLLSNAVKFTAEGGQIGLQVEGDPQNELVRFCVWDTGIGISPEQAQKLFRPFVQIDSGLSRQYGGTGLGLSLVYRMAEMHNGGVTLESELGQGSRFILTLPWSPQADEEVTSLPAWSGHSAPRKVLVIEESPVIEEQLTYCFEQLGLSTEVNWSGECSLQQAVDLHPDLIFVDLQMPAQAGQAFLRDLRSSPWTSSMALVAVSAHDDGSQGAETLLAKPVSPARLASALRTALSPGKEPPQPSGPSSGPGPMILLAEDNLANQATYTDYLTARGFRVTPAANGLEAIERALEIRPDLVLMDIQMPGVDGLEAIRRLRSHPDLQTMPILALTALVMPGDSQKCIEAGANEYLTKPLSLRRLVQVIEKYLAR